MKLRITVHGVAYDVEVEVLDAGEGFRPLPQSLPQIQRPVPSGAAVQAAAPPQAGGTASPTPAGGGSSIHSPIAGNVLSIPCKAGDSVAKDQILLVIEAMKMETSIAAPTAGVIKSVNVAVGDVVRENQILVTFQ